MEPRTQKNKNSDHLEACSRTPQVAMALFAFIQSLFKWEEKKPIIIAFRDTYITVKKMTFSHS